LTPVLIFQSCSDFYNLYLLFVVNAKSKAAISLKSLYAHQTLIVY
jgi:hypothetical protein